MTPDSLFVVLGDSPRMPTGLGRIAGDLAALAWQSREELGIELVQVGWEYGRPHLRGAFPWPLISFPEIGQDWGASQIVPLIEELRESYGLESKQVVLFSVWDPARCFEYVQVPYSKWGYFAIDGHNRHKAIGGPAGETLYKYDRPLAYTRYGAEIISNTLKQKAYSPDPVSFLPHGHYLDADTRARAEQAAAPPRRGWRLGCVATNQPRKDIGLFFAVLRWLRDAGEPVHGWLHTDELITGAWSIPELVSLYDVGEWMTISTAPASDAWLESQYAGCAVTLAVGRGEGHGYPIVESLAMGRPVVHCDYAGGAEITPVNGRVLPRFFDAVNPYGIERPVLDVGEVATRCLVLAQEMLSDPTLPAFYAGTVAHLHWRQLWPRWESWMRQGLREIRESL